MEKKLIIIAGPTASGKTAAGIALAKHYSTAVVSADSRQFYREMTIGTAKPTPDELATARHYFIDTLSVTERYTAGKYEKDCLELLHQLFMATDTVVMVGGSGLFIKAVCEGFDEFPDVRPEIREKLILDFRQQGIGFLQNKLKSADPEYYALVDINNHQRVIRALEVIENTGKPFSSFRTAAAGKRNFSAIKFGLNLPREQLYERINRRVDMMVAQGLVDEAASLLPYRHYNALNTVGYSELFDYFDGKTELGAAIELIKQNTRRFAKRQLTWFRKDKEINWIRADGDAVEKIISKVSNTE